MTATIENIRAVSVDTWAKDAANAERDFFAAMFNGLEQFQQGNHQHLAKALTIASGKTCKRIKRVEAQKIAFAPHMRRVILGTIDNVTIKFVKDSDFGYTFTVGDNGGVNSAKLEAVRLLAVRGARTTGKAAEEYKKAFPLATPKSDATSKRDLMWKKRATIETWCKANKIPFSQFAAVMTAKKGDDPRKA